MLRNLLKQRTLLNAGKYTVAYKCKLYEFKLYTRLFSSDSDCLSSPLDEVRDLHDNSYSKLISKCLTADGNTKFWGKIAESRIDWQQKFDSVNQSDLSEGKVKWFSNGKLNASVNCLDRHVAKYPDRVALIWEKDEPGHHETMTYKQLMDLTCRIGNLLRSEGVKKGDSVILYLPMSPYIVASMLACARIGAIHSVVFAGFSSDAVAARIQDVPCGYAGDEAQRKARVKVVITADQAVRGGKVIDLKKTVDAAIAKCQPGQIQKVFVHQRTGADVPMGPNDIFFEKTLDQCSTECAPEMMDSNDVLFILYTSGSTGKPKGIAHSTGGYLVYTNFTHQQVFDLRPAEDIFGCVADVGWITGHSYIVYGPLSNGATSVIFESTPIYPDPGRYWELVERIRLSHIYLAPTALRLLLKHGDEWVQKYDRSSLRILGCVGEPLNHEAWEWYNDVVGEGRCDVVDTWWQTETGGIMISPRPSARGAPIRPGMPMRPLPGIDPVLLDEQGHELHGNGVHGALCMRNTWPGMAITLWGDQQRFVDTYFKPQPGYFFTGDGAHRHMDGSYQITGRMDDVINTSGHRLGTAEIEDVLDEHPSVAETAVVGFPHPIKGEAVYAYVMLKDHVTHSQEEIRFQLREKVKGQVAPYAVPEIIQLVSNLPKTRSGKIMRRILRKIAADQATELGDTSTLADPSVVQQLLENHRQVMEARKKFQTS